MHKTTIRYSNYRYISGGGVAKKLYIIKNIVELGVVDFLTKCFNQATKKDSQINVSPY